MEVMEIYHQIKESSAEFAILIKLSRRVKIALAIFVAYAHHQCAKNTSICNKIIFLVAFMQGSSRRGQSTPLVVGVKLDKNAQLFHQIFVLLEQSV